MQAVLFFNKRLNPLGTNRLSHPYYLDESTFILGAIRVVSSFLFHLSMKITLANRKAPDETPLFSSSHLGLLCLPMSHEKDARLKWVNFVIILVNLQNVCPKVVTAEEWNKFRKKTVLFFPGSSELSFVDDAIVESMLSLLSFRHPVS